MRQISCCVFDLETTSLNADFGIVLCGVILGQDGNPVTFRGDAYKTWKTKRSDDSAIVTDIVKELSRYDIWCAHNGSRFDTPYLRTRLLRWGLPPLPTRKVVDPLQLARNKLRMRSNSLRQIANMLKCNSKTDLDPHVWLEASLDGSKEAMDEVVRHCREDVFTLEKVLDGLKDYSTAFNSWGSGV